MKLLIIVVLLFLTNDSSASTALVNGQWYYQGVFSTQDWYIVAGKLTKEKPSKITTTINLQGDFVLPPYGEAHNHNLQNPWLAQNFHQRYVKDGVFYGLMMCGSHQDYNKTVKMLSTLPLSIDMVAACISSSDGHPLRMALQPEPGQPDIKPAEVYDSTYVVVDSIEDASKKWPLFAANKANWVKIVLVHSEQLHRRTDQRFFGVNGLKPEIVKPLVTFLQKKGLRVAAHVESAADYAVAVEAGVDLVAHLPGYQWWNGYSPEVYKLSDESIVMAAAKKIPIVATAGVTTLFKSNHEQQLVRVRAMQRDNLHRLKKAGVQILIGSDRFDGNVLAEVDYLRTLSVFSDQQLLKMLVSDTVRFLYPQRAVGHFSEGAEANFLVLDANPLKDWSALRRVKQRVWQGEVLQLSETLN